MDRSMATNDRPACGALARISLDVNVGIALPPLEKAVPDEESAD
jgi:hypothetical protein